MNAYKLALIMAAHGALDALTKVVEVTTPENQTVLAPITGQLIDACSTLLDLVQGAPPPPPPPPPPPAATRR